MGESRFRSCELCGTVLTAAYPNGIPPTATECTHCGVQFEDKCDLLQRGPDTFEMRMRTVPLADPLMKAAVLRLGAIDGRLRSLQCGHPTESPIELIAAQLGSISRALENLTEVVIAIEKRTREGG